MSANVERNSEGKKTITAMVVSGVWLLLTVLDRIFGWGIIPDDQIALSGATGIGGLTAAVAAYSASRGKKKAAEALAGKSPPQ